MQMVEVAALFPNPINSNDIHIKNSIISQMIIIIIYELSEGQKIVRMNASTYKYVQSGYCKGFCYSQPP